jgi:hypothetical protein
MYKARVKKERFDVIIRTLEEQIEGTVFVMNEMRLLDMLNKSDEDFIAVANARVYDQSTGKLMFQADFLAQNKSQIVFIAERCKPPPVP